MHSLRAKPYHTDFSKLINVKAFYLFPGFLPLHLSGTIKRNIRARYFAQLETSKS